MVVRPAHLVIHGHPIAHTIAHRFGHSYGHSFGHPFPVQAHPFDRPSSSIAQPSSSNCSSDSSELIRLLVQVRPSLSKIISYSFKLAQLLSQAHPSFHPSSSVHPSHPIPSSDRHSPRPRAATALPRLRQIPLRNTNQPIDSKRHRCEQQEQHNDDNSNNVVLLHHLGRLLCSSCFISSSWCSVEWKPRGANRRKYFSSLNFGSSCRARYLLAVVVSCRTYEYETDYKDNVSSTTRILSLWSKGLPRSKTCKVHQVIIAPNAANAQTAAAAQNVFSAWSSGPRSQRGRWPRDRETIGAKTCMRAPKR